MPSLAAILPEGVDGWLRPGGGASGAKQEDAGDRKYASMHACARKGGHAEHGALGDQRSSDGLAATGCIRLDVRWRTIHRPRKRGNSTST
ncbi:MAG TPA: hypothetical protein PKE20_06450 [Promineifilum sp.]|nr:hypothetical protein [Promineifilum sp.]